MSFFEELAYLEIWELDYPEVDRFFEVKAGVQLSKWSSYSKICEI